MAVLCVSHADAEDLADRIRHHLIADGKVHGPALEGPGWACPRLYQQGDRVLFHTRFGGRSSGIVNGTTATVLTTGPTGLTVRLDTPADPDGTTGRAVELTSAFVAGMRPDGSSNLSHAWARTIDGAQGGTWPVAHLLGTPALDQYRGYVGQSRSQHPTHTWNTTPAPVIDHGGVPAEQREPGEHVLAALTRTPDTSLAARSDPYDLDRHLRALIAAHQAVLAHRPPDQTIQLICAEAALRQAQQDHADAVHQVARANGRRDDLNPLGALSSHGRAQRRDLAGEVARGEKRLNSASAALADAEARLGLLTIAQADRDAFNGSEGWRDAEIARLHDQLDAHWADVAITCARADDPLAYGTDVLRNAHFHVSHRLELIEQRVPPDRSREWRLARQDLGVAINDRDQARCDIADARQRLDAASGTRWRSKPDETAAAQQGIEAALRRLRAATNLEERLQPQLEELAEHQAARERLIAATSTERHELASNRALLVDALGSTLASRVQSLAHDPPDHLTRALGPVPDSATGRSKWCHHAARLEQAIDNGLQPGDIRPDRAARHHIVAADGLDATTIKLPEPAGVERWATLADEVDRQLSAHRGRGPTIEVDHGIDPSW